MDERPRVRTVWPGSDFTVLTEVGRWATSMPPRRPPWALSVEQIAERAQLPAADAGFGVARLHNGGYLEANFNTTQESAYPEAMVTGLTAQGLRAVGAWPSEETFGKALAQALEELADRLGPKEKDKASWLRLSAKVVGELVMAGASAEFSQLIVQLAGQPHL